MKESVIESILLSPRSLIVEGDLYAGKTSNIIFPIVDKIVEKKENLVILDSKEEYINNYYERLKNIGYNIIILNFKDLTKSNGWNPLYYAYTLYKNGKKDESLDYIDIFLDNVFCEELKEDTFFLKSARALLRGCIISLFMDGKDSEINLSSVNNILSLHNNKFDAKSYLQKYLEIKGINELPYLNSSAFLSSHKDTKDSIIATLRERMNIFYGWENIIKFLNKTTFKYEFETPICFLILIDETKNEINRFATMFLNELYKIIVDLKLRIKTNLILDNFDSIKFNKVVSLLSTGPYNNVKAIVATRSVNDLLNKYGTYIGKLCNLVTIKNDRLDIVINSVYRKEEKSFTNVIVKKTNVEYPTLNMEKPAIMDVKKYVLTNNIIPVKSIITEPRIKCVIDDSLNKNISPDYLSKSQLDIDTLIKDIDKKLEELDKSEAENKQEIKKETNEEEIVVEKKELIFEEKEQDKPNDNIRTIEIKEERKSDLEQFKFE